MLKQCGDKLIIKLLRVLADRHALGIKILDFNMLFAKADAVRGDRIAEVLPQFGAIIKVEVKTTLLGNAEKLVQYLQPCAVVQRRNGTFQGGKCRQQMPLHLYKAFAGLFYAGFVRGHDDVFMLHHISIFAGVGLDLAVAFGAEGIKAVVLAVVQHITGKGFFIHALADDADLHPAVSRDARVDRAKLR